MSSVRGTERRRKLVTERTALPLEMPCMRSAPNATDTESIRLPSATETTLDCVPAIAKQLTTYALSEINMAGSQLSRYQSHADQLLCRSTNICLSQLTCQREAELRLTVGGLLAQIIDNCRMDVSLRTTRIVDVDIHFLCHTMATSLSKLMTAS